MKSKNTGFAPALLRGVLGAALAVSLVGCSDEEVERTKEAAKEAVEKSKEVAKEAIETTKEASKKVAKQAVEKSKEAYEQAKEGMDGTKLVPLCCYTGDYTMAYLKDIRFSTGGGELTVEDALPGLAAREGMVGADLPTESITIARIINRDAEEQIRGYDANDDGLLDEPEAVVMYLVELAKGMGSSVSGLTKDGEDVRALRVSVAERSGIAAFAQAHKTKLTDAAQAIFDAVEELR
ncbi:MAG: hypothetical protein AAF493_04315 [Pseudomonadota bacterium]